MDPVPPSPDARPHLEIAQGVLLGAGIVGFADGMDAVAESAVPLSTAAKVGLGLASAGLLAPVVLALLMPLVVLAGHRIATLAGDPPRWPGFWMGLGGGVPILLGLHVLLGADPGGRTAAAALVAPVAAGAVALAVAPGRARVFAIMLGLAPLVVQVELGRRRVPTSGFPEADAPHVLLVTVEGLRGGDWPAPAPRLPGIGALAADGVRFERAFTPVPSVEPALDAVLEGRQPWEGSATPSASLGTVLRDAGWRTGAVSGRAAVIPDRDAGFEVARTGAALRTAASGSLLARVLGALGLAPPARRPDREVVEDTLAWLEQAGVDRHRPTFTWVHLAGAADPVTPTPPWDTAYASGDPWDPGRPPLVEALALPASTASVVGDRTDPAWLLGQHAGAASAADAAVARLVEAVDAIPGERPRVIAVVGTHGLALGEGDVWLQPESPPTDATARVALLVRAPTQLPRGTVSDEAVSLVDLPPTLLELAGVRSEPPLGGASLVPTAFGRRGRGWVGVRAADGAAATLFGRWWTWPHPGGELQLRPGAVVPESVPQDALEADAAALATGRDPGDADPALRLLGAP